MAASVLPDAALDTIAAPLRWNTFLRVGFRFCFYTYSGCFIHRAA